MNEQDKAISEEEKKKKEAEEARLKEPVKAKLMRLALALRGATGSAKKDALDDLETTVTGLKTEETVGDSDAEKELKKEREEREKAEKKAREEREKERKAAELGK